VYLEFFSYTSRDGGGLLERYLQKNKKRHDANSLESLLEFVSNENNLAIVIPDENGMLRRLNEFHLCDFRIA